MKYAAIIAAGGVGQRFGRDGGKQLFMVQDKPLLIYTLEKFQNQVDQIIVVIDSARELELRDYLKEYQIKVDEIVASGAQRFDSVQNGLAAVNADIDVVLIHDGARPNVSGELIGKLKKVLIDHKAVIPVVPVVDTIKMVKDNKVVDTPDRDKLYRVQTPQCFNKDLILAAYSSVDLAGCTDDAMVAERYGQTVKVVPGEMDNIKITTFEDLRLLKF